MCLTEKKVCDPAGLRWVLLQTVALKRLHILFVENEERKKTKIIYKCQIFFFSF